jgi:hypothetical protein
MINFIIRDVFMLLTNDNNSLEEDLANVIPVGANATKPISELIIIKGAVVHLLV